MTSIIKKTLTAITAASVVLTLIGSTFVSAFASEPTTSKTLQGSKFAEKIEKDKYGVSVNVPGDSESGHDEVILMVDGSYSGDKEWPAMRDAINAIGNAVLNGSGSTQLTLMAFGMGDNIVLEHVIDPDALSKALGDLPSYLLRGVSSTNCEAGFTGVGEYIQNHNDELKDAIVIYITDGGINTDETPRKFYDWQSYAKSVDNVIKYTLMGVPNDLAEDATKEDKIAFVNDLWKKVFEHSGMDINGEYPISEMERAFLQYDEDNKVDSSYSFLIAMKSGAFDKYPNVWSRTYDSVFGLSTIEDVKDLYLVRYQNDSRATWMPDAAAKSESDNIHYVKSDSISSLTDALSDTIEALSKTPYNDVAVTDYMSKWINLIPETIKVVDKNGDVVAEFDAENSTKNEDGEFTSYVYKWTSEPLCAEKAPIILDLIPEEEYAAGGPEVEGNVSGDIYRITWNIKDGPLYRYDSYSLKYDVTVDYDEPELKFDTNLPTNGNTDVEYTNEEKIRIKVKIEVPEIIVVPEPVEVEISGTKYLDGDVAAGFEFVLEGNTIDGFTAASAEDGSFVFETLRFTQTGVFEFTVKEIIDIADEDIVYDETIYTVKVTVERNKDVLEADVVVSVDGEVYEGAIEFYNSTSEDIPDNPPPLDPPKTGENTIGFIILAVAAMTMLTVIATKKRMA